MFGILPLLVEYIRVGKLRALAVTTATRSAALPDIPTVGEFVPGYEARLWHGVGAPKNTPNEIVDKLNKEINAGLADPNMKARLADLGAVPMPMTPAEFGKFMADETEKWGKVIRAANIKADKAAPKFHSSRYANSASGRSITCHSANPIALSGSGCLSRSRLIITQSMANCTNCHDFIYLCRV